MEHEDFDVLQSFISQGGTLKMLADVDDEELGTLYQYSLQLLAGQDFEGAKRILYLLYRVDSWNFDYCFTLAQVYQNLGEHHEAIFLFGRAGMIQVDNPLPAFQAGQSYLACKNLEFAEKSFNASIRWSAGRPIYAELEASAQYALEQLAKENKDARS
ncbi:CesD/SycD/LcrH family type III secretion system chaperone [Parashewanella curva]|uniref:CesD/SycD/LcrH family type III secretion system chaperone n=1 Tax=Parashewanella curva TaxID=2338552 RepID=A0A3L8PXC1_9GAMM|nr:CesD/SycD/LcrH family type III secretion system chaperone [Parashewanella curva]RLV59971.1 CesD/SycD/LcrH family type III secretion system chaperone [Parashewanella curva]